MKKHTLHVLCLALILFCKHFSFGQLSGIYSVPGSYTSIGSAINTLNQFGVSGAVTINIAAGYSETVAVGGYSLFSVIGSSTLNTVTFQKSGSGTNPQLVAYSGGSAVPTSPVQDGVLKLIGADNIILDGLTITDNNLTNNATMEYGIGLFKANVNNGCQNNTIRNCTISLNRVNNAIGLLGMNGSIGIEVMNAAPGNHTLTLAALSADASNSNNKFYGNLIQNCNYGISLAGTTGTAIPTFPDAFNEVGSLLAVNANTITNFGGITGASYIACGVYARGQSRLSVMNNVIDNNNGGGALQSNSRIYGILTDYTDKRLSVSGNTLSIKSGSLCPEALPIFNDINGPANCSLVNISNNLLSGCSTSINPSAKFSGINNYGNADTILISSNSFTNCLTTATVGTTSLVRNDGFPRSELIITGNNLNFTFTDPNNYAGDFNVIYNSNTGYKSKNVSITNNSFGQVIMTGISANINYIMESGTQKLLTVQNNTWQPGTLDVGGTVNFILNYGTNGPSVTVNANTINNFTLTAPAPTIFIYNVRNNNSEGNQVIISNNTFTNLRVTGASAVFNGIRSISNNSYFSPRRLIYNNLLSNIKLNSTQAMYGFILDNIGDGNGLTPTAIYSNTLSSLENFSSIYGLVTTSSVSLGSTAPLIYANVIHSLVTSGTGTAPIVKAVYFLAGPRGLNFYGNKITSIISTNTANATGVEIGSGDNVNIYNNIIGNVNASSTSTISIKGLNISGGKKFKVYYNSIYLSGSSYGSTCFNAISTATVDVRNNILVNLLPGSSSSVGLAQNVSIGSNYDYASNNNLFYAASGQGLMPGASSISALKTLVLGREKNSVTENVAFASTTPTASNYLGINPSLATQVESGAQPISWISTDFYGNPRDPSSPDIGASEGIYTPSASDSLAPVLKKFGFSTPLCNLSSRTFTAELVDKSGISSGTLSPQLYYKVNSGTYTSSPGSLSVGTSTSGVWTFNLSYASNYGDIISWFMVAQDASTLSNIMSWPVPGFGGSSVNTVTSTPTPATYTVYMPLNGTYTVGSGGTFTTLTQAANAYNNACLSGPVTFVLTNTLYNTPSETFPIVFRNNPEANSTNSLLIIPSSGTSVTVRGSTVNAINAVLQFDDASYITLDGLNSSGSSMTAINTNTYYTTNVLVMSNSSSLTPGNHHITFKNLNVASTSPDYGVGLYGKEYMSYITLQNNYFYSLNSAIEVGIYDDPTLSKLNNWLIENNQIGPVTTSTANLKYQGITLYSPSLCTVRNNTVSNISNAYTFGSAIGIYLYGPINNVTVTSNVVRDLKYTGTGDSPFTGISIYPTSPTSDILISNNMVTNIQSPSTSGSFAFEVENGLPQKSLKLYNNTFALTYSTSMTSTVAALTGCVKYDAYTDIDMRNNILYTNVSNSGNASSKSYCVLAYYDLPMSSMDYNDYFAEGNQAFLAGYQGTISTLANLKNAFGMNLNSISVKPVFTSSVDAHLAPATPGNALLDNMGIPNPTVTIDIDGQTRSGTTPDMGADEFTATGACTAASGGTISVPNFTICGAQPVTLNATNLSGGTNSIYQWLVSPTSVGTYTNVAYGTGYNSPNLFAGVLPGGTYFFKLTETCQTNSLSANSNVVLVTVVAQPTLNITATNTVVCGTGNSATLSASGASNYTWSTGSTSSSIVITPTASGNYYVYYGSAPCSFSASANIPILYSNGPTVSVVSSNSTLCSGGQATLTASGAGTYSWSNGATTASISVSPTLTTAYTVTGFISGACGSSASTSITVNASPNLTVTGSPTICAGQSTTLNVSGASTYTWSTGANSSTLLASPSSNTVYYVIGRSSGSCTSTSNFSVAVAPSFTLGVSGAGTICAGQTASLTATGASNYTWSTGAFTSSVTVSPSVTSIYTITGESGGCSLSTTRTLSVSANPTVYITGSTVACLGQTGTLVANGATSYTWDSGSTANTLTISPLTTTTYTLIGSNGSCQAQTSITVNTSTVPVITTAASATSVCPSAPVSFTAFGANTYTWSNSATGNSSTFNPTAASVYTVNGSNTAGCANSATVSVGLYSLPSITVTPPSATVCALSPVNFSASGASTYTWNGNTSGTSVTLTPASSLFYQLTGTSAQGCTNTVFFGVTTNPLPTLSINPPSASVCIGSAAGFTANGASSYTWNGSIISPVVSFLPFSNTTYTVSGTNASNCIGTATVGVITNSLPVVSVSPSATTVCAFSNTTLTASGANSSYAWSNALSGSSITISAASSTVITVVGTNTTGCSSSPVNATLNILPLPSLSITASAYTVCQGAQSTLTALGALSYTWNVGSLVTNTPVVIVTPTSSSVYQVIGTGTNGCSNSFSNAVSTSIVMIPSPAMSISGNTVICTGKSTTLTTLAPTAISYSWTTSNTSQSISVSPLVATNYSVTITDAFGCSNTASVSVLVNSLPTVSINGNSVVCNGTPVTLTASGAVSYLWSTSSTQSSVTVSPSSASAYSVLGTDVNGCQASASQTINVAASPSVSVIASNTVVCAGNTVVLQGSGANTYTWSGGITNNVPFAPAGPGTYSVSGTSTNGCQGYASVSIGINPLPVISVSGNSLVCEGTVINLIASGAQSFVWSNNQNGSSISIITAPNLSYSVTGTDANGCQGTGSITLTPYPKPNLQVNSTTPFLCLGDSTFLTVSGALKYLWNNSDTTQSIQIKPLVNTTYTVTGVDLNGCSDTTSYEQIVGDCTGLISVTGGENTIHIYPNPNHGQFTIHLSGHEENCFLEVYTALGQLVYKNQLSEQKTNYNLADQAKGVYTVRITQKGKNLQHLKLIIE